MKIRSKYNCSVLERSKFFERESVQEQNNNINFIDCSVLTKNDLQER